MGDSLEDVYKTLSNGKRALTTDLSGQATNNGDGIITTSYADDSVTKKQAYSCRQTFTIADTGIKGIVFDPTSLPFDAFLEPFRISVTVGPVRVKLYADVEITAGLTELPVFNRYGLLDDPPHVMGVYDTWTDLDLGSNPPLEYVVGAKSTNQNSAGAVAAGERIFTFLSTKKYYLEFDNNEGAGDSTTVSLQFDWFEVG